MSILPPRNARMLGLMMWKRALKVSFPGAQIKYIYVLGLKRNKGRCTLELAPSVFFSLAISEGKVLGQG
jgi:hypothetical protein